MSSPKPLLHRIVSLIAFAGFLVRALAQDTAFLASAKNIDAIKSTVELPLYNATLADGSTAYYIVTEASTKEAADSLGVNHAAALDGLKDPALVQVVRASNAARTAPLKQQLQGIQVPHGVNFLYGKRTVVPDPKTGFPPMAATYSAQGNPGYSPLMQLPDGTILNAPHVAVQYANGTLATHPKVVSLSLKKQTAVLQLTSGFSQGKPIVYLSTEASDPLAATLENVPYVPSLAKTPTTALIDLAAFTNGQTGAKNPQRQGLGSAILDGLSPLNIPADTPASPAYSPLWAINLAKWVGPAGDRQTSFSAVQALSASGQVASFNPKDPSSNPPLGPSGIVVNCPIVAVVPDAVAAIDPQFGSSIGALPRAGGRSMGEACTPSTLGYSCQVPAGPVVIHYTLGGPKPPANPCTSSSMPTSSGSSATGANADLAHFAIQGNPPGYLAMSFAQNEGSMFPADAVLGYLDSSTTSPNVKSYHLTRYGISPSDETNGWAQHAGFSQQDGMKLLCFSRALDAPQAAVIKTINPNAATPINWAIGSSDALMQHLQSGSLAISFAGGGVSGISDSSSTASTAVRIAHGVMMLAVFALMMPSAALAARHKWLFGGKDGKVKSAWFLTHRSLAMLAMVLAIAAVILIFVQFKWAGRAATDVIYTPHRAVGMTAIAAMLVQGLLGAFRPHLNTQKRPAWKRVHQVWGAVTIALGLAACYMGIVLINKLSNISMMYWLGPAVAVPMALLLMGLSLEYPKIKLQKRGIYNKEQHILKSVQHAEGSKDTPLNV